jgi:hypothetical protein
LEYIYSKNGDDFEITSIEPMAYLRKQTKVRQHDSGRFYTNQLPFFWEEKMETSFQNRHVRVQQHRGKKKHSGKNTVKNKKRKVDQKEEEDDGLGKKYQDKVKGLQTEYRILAAKYLTELNEEVKKEMDEIQEKIKKLEEVLGKIE